MGKQERIRGEKRGMGKSKGGKSERNMRREGKGQEGKRRGGRKGDNDLQRQHTNSRVRLCQ